MKDTILSILASALWSRSIRKSAFPERFLFLTIEEQQLLFKRLSKESYRVFREKQRHPFGTKLQDQDRSLDSPIDSSSRMW